MTLTFALMNFPVSMKEITMKLNDDGSVDKFIRGIAGFARIQAMIAENNFRLAKGQTITYGEDAFLEVADEMENLWRNY